MHALMFRLFGPSRYFVEGGDWGATIASWMAYQQPDALLGFHINMISVYAEDATPTTTEEKDLIARRAGGTPALCRLGKTRPAAGKP